MKVSQFGRHFTHICPIHRCGFKILYYHYMQRKLPNKHSNHHTTTVTSVCMHKQWRGLFSLYLMFLIFQQSHQIPYYNHKCECPAIWLTSIISVYIIVVNGTMYLCAWFVIEVAKLFLEYQRYSLKYNKKRNKGIYIEPTKRVLNESN